MFGKRARILRIEAAEMEKTEGPSVDFVAGANTGDLALPDVPIGQVEAGIAKDGYTFKEAGYEVDPALIDEESFGQVDDTLIVELLLPPLEEAPGFGGAAETDEAKVVDARAKDVELAGLSVVLERGGEMRSQDE